MTREEILQIEPGKELDRLVAIHIMGWSEDDVENKTIVVPPPYDCKINWTTIWDENGNPLYLPDYSTNIKDAWEVVDKLKGNGIYLDIYTGETTYKCGGYSESYGDEIEHVEAETAPEAICKAALLTLTTQ